MIFYYRSNAKSWAFFGFRVEGFDSWVHWFVVLHIVANIVYSELLILCFGSWFNGLLICVFTGNCTLMFDEFKKSMMNEFKMIDCITFWV